MGFDFHEKSPSKYFIITLLVCEDILIAKKIKAAVRKTIQQMNRKKGKSRLIHELKGSDTSLAVKQHFLTMMQKFAGWQLHAIVLNKINFAKNVSTPIDRTRLYGLLVHEILKEVNLLDAKTVSLLVDKCQSKKVIKDFDNYLRASLNLLLPIDCILNITHEVSQEGLGIQAVDMFCYGFFRKHEFNDLQWYSQFQEFILSERKYETQGKKKTDPAMRTPRDHQVNRWKAFTPGT